MPRLRPQVESTSAVLRNMQHLCNLLRPVQARQTLLHTLRSELEQRRAAAQELRWAALPSFQI